MVSIPVQGSHCHRTEVIKAGKQANGTQRYRCQTANANGGSFSGSTRIGAGCQRSVTKWSIWPSTVVALAIRPACCPLALRRGSPC